MVKAAIEHVNISVKDNNLTAKMLEAIFDWKIRWQGIISSGGLTMHIGDDENYIAAYTPKPDENDIPFHSKGKPLNHIGIIVDNLDEIEKRVLDFGLKTFAHGDYDPGRRFYFFDNDGVEWEIISYS